MIATARIDYTYESNEWGIDRPCVYADCNSGSGQVGPIWGHGENSVRRALATLTEECDCGALYHEEEEGL